VLRGSLLVEFAFKHSDILHEVTVVELHRTVEDCSLTLHESIRGLLEKYPTVFFYANTWWIII
jgi:hypothetical protein